MNEKGKKYYQNKRNAQKFVSRLKEKRRRSSLIITDNHQVVFCTILQEPFPTSLFTSCFISRRTYREN